MPRRPAPPPPSTRKLTDEQIITRLSHAIDELSAIGGGYEMSNGQLRARALRLQRYLRALRRRLR